MHRLERLNQQLRLALGLDFDLDVVWIQVGCRLDLDLDALDFHGKCFSSDGTVQYISN